MEPMRAESHAVAVSEHRADAGCGRCPTTIGGEAVHACLGAVRNRGTVGGALERGRNLRSALELDVGALGGPAADLILPLIR